MKKICYVILMSFREEKEKWIRRKYEQKEFLPPLPHKDVAVHQVNVLLYQMGSSYSFKKA